MPYTPEEFDQKFSALPEDLQKAMGSVETSKTIQDIAKKYSLHVDQMGKLTDEMTAIMLGDTHPQEFVNKIRDNVTVDQNTASAIAQELNQRVFLAIRESLKKIHNIADENIIPTAESKTDVLKGIEEPETMQMTVRAVIPPPQPVVTTPPPAAPTPTPPPRPTPPPSPLPTSNVFAAPEPVKPTPTITPTMTPVVKKPAIDPYKEQI